MRLRDFMPRSLFQRALLIVVVPLVILQGVVTVLVFEQQWAVNSRALSRALAGDVAAVTRLWAQAETMQARDDLSALAEEELGLALNFQPGTDLPARRRTPLSELIGDPLRREVSDRVRNPVYVDANRYPTLVEIRVGVEGGVLRILARKERAYARGGYVLVVWMAGSAIALSGVAAIFLRNQVKPIRRLAHAASEFGKGRDVEDFKPSGAREVRSAAGAFLRMRARIRRHIAQRTALLAGVGHDLRTPMTRMKLELALLGEHPAKERLAGDLDEMERLLDDYLDFARGQSSDAPQPTDLTVLIGEVVDQARRGLEAHQSLETGLPDALTAPAQPVPIRRCLANLIDNGVRHAQRVRVHASALPDAVEICVDDDGPGIAEEDRETAFKPFSGVGGREPEGGSGLGLAIARDIARAHGGDLTLGRSPIGGLSCRLRLPV